MSPHSIMMFILWLLAVWFSWFANHRNIILYTARWWWPAAGGRSCTETSRQTCNRWLTMFKIWKSAEISYSVRSWQKNCTKGLFKDQCHSTVINWTFRLLPNIVKHRLQVWSRTRICWWTWTRCSSHSSGPAAWSSRATAPSLTGRGCSAHRSGCVTSSPDRGSALEGESTRENFSFFFETYTYIQRAFSLLVERTYLHCHIQDIIMTLY